MSYVEFDYGSNLISDANQQKIKSLAKALSERPGLTMEITGYADPEKDKEGLKQAAFDHQIKAQKLKNLVRKGEPAFPVEQIRIEPEEYEKYLKFAYEAGNFPKPRNAIGMLKELPTPEMEKLMNTHITVTDSDLRLLISRRAENVKELLLKAGDIAPARIFRVDPQSVSPQKKEKVKESRVEFKLK